MIYFFIWLIGIRAEILRFNSTGETWAKDHSVIYAVASLSSPSKYLNVTVTLILQTKESYWDDRLCIYFSRCDHGNFPVYRCGHGTISISDRGQRCSRVRIECTSIAHCIKRRTLIELQISVVESDYFVPFHLSESYVGCLHADDMDLDNKLGERHAIRPLTANDPFMTVNYCNNLCLAFPYFALRNGVDCLCYTANITSYTRLREYFCREPCTSDPNQMCGSISSGVSVYTPSESKVGYGKYELGACRCRSGDCVILTGNTQEQCETACTKMVSYFHWHDASSQVETNIGADMLHADCLGYSYRAIGEDSSCYLYGDAFPNMITMPGDCYQKDSFEVVFGGTFCISDSSMESVNSEQACFDFCMKDSTCVGVTLALTVAGVWQCLRFEDLSFCNPTSVLGLSDYTRSDVFMRVAPPMMYDVSQTANSGISSSSGGGGGGLSIWFSSLISCISLAIIFYFGYRWIWKEDSPRRSEGIKPTTRLSIFPEVPSDFENDETNGTRSAALATFVRGGEEQLLGERDNRAPGGVPYEYVCPITQALMEDPVQATDGRIYERTAILKWFERSAKSPMTNMRITNFNLKPLPKLKSEIHDFKKRNKVEFRSGGHFHE